MRCSTALVLSTLAVGQAAAASARHASFHARRQAEQKRGYDDVDWSKVSYDLGKVNWSSVFSKPAAEPTPTAQPEVKVESKPSTPAAAAPSTPAAKTTGAAKPKETGKSNPVEETVGDLLQGVSSLLSKMKISGVGQNDKSNNGKMWIGDSSDWKTTFTNDKDEDVVLLCWASNGFTGMTLNVNKPAISISIPSGKSQTISFAPNVPGACAPAYKDTTLANFGGVDNTWFEYTFGNNGAFDITRNVKMQGNNISAKGSKCTSDMETCVFKCTGGQQSCEKGYDLFNCGASNGGGGGYDPVMQGTGGGCAMGASGEHVKVTFS
ncbi:hypothetical protein K469DRAFT_709425 [Zopfia rhizophila CBS 207.26]|uniref:Effector 5 n=1 Tax=Zopfia rhizophila CBS 207.26 TaxID=1314779 RepID=A0A6A6ERM8_9PEZI|nr:hypothetical protein K469DRAFT_709425 [Zopfia rhizophila CBS 207.26]